MLARRLCIIALTCCFALPAVADDSTGWRALYREGSRSYDLGDFRAALDAFKRAYLAHEEPGILFDIAECHRQLGENADAVHAYQSYLRRKPNADNRAAVEALIAKLEDAPARPTAPPVPSPPKPSVTPPPAPSPAETAPAATPPSPAPTAPVAAHGTVYNPWGTTPAATPPPLPPSPATEPTAEATAAAPAPPPGAAAPSTAATPTEAGPATPAPPSWTPSAVVETTPPRKKSRAWIAAIVVPSVVVLAVSIGVTAWYFSPEPTYTKLGSVQ